MATATPRAVVLPAAQERRPPGPSRKEIVSAQQERRNFGRRLREGVDPMDPVRTLHHLLFFHRVFPGTHCRITCITSILRRATRAVQRSSAKVHDTRINAQWHIQLHTMSRTL